MEKIKLHFENTRSYGTRYGFNHETTLVCSDGRTFKNVCHYINRTWEAYPFQSVKRGAVCMLINDDVEKMIADYKKAHGFDKKEGELKTTTYTDLFGETHEVVLEKPKTKRLPNGLRESFYNECRLKYADFYRSI